MRALLTEMRDLEREMLALHRAHMEKAEESMRSAGEAHEKAMQRQARLVGQARGVILLAGVVLLAMFVWSLIRS